MSKLFCMIGLMASLPLAACGSEGGTTQDDGDDGDPVDCTSSDAPTYETFGKEFVETYCLECHSENVEGPDRMQAPESDNFDTLEEIQRKADELVEEVVEKKDMPFATASRQPSDEERALFGVWLECGGK